MSGIPSPLNSSVLHRVRMMSRDLRIEVLRSTGGTCIHDLPTNLLTEVGPEVGHTSGLPNHTFNDVTSYRFLRVRGSERYEGILRNRKQLTVWTCLVPIHRTPYPGHTRLVTGQTFGEGIGTDRCGQTLRRSLRFDPVKSHQGRYQRNGSLGRIGSLSMTCGRVSDGD